jgi:hypothetical protein
MQQPYTWLLALALLLPTRLLAQKPKAPVIPADTVYFDQDWERTAILEDAKYARLVRHDPAGKPLGTVRDFYYPGWKKQGEGKLLSEAPDVLTGQCTGWHPNGKMAFRGTYLKGVAQGDFQQWNEAGVAVKCGLVTKELFTQPAPTTLHARYTPNESSTVYTVRVPSGIDAVFYALDVRDEGQPPISLERIVGMGVMTAKAFVGDTPGAISSFVGQMTSKINTTLQDQMPVKPTKCRFLITADAEVASAYAGNKGRIQAAGMVLNRPLSSDIIALPAGCQEFYVCISNDNLQTDAIAQLSVKGVVQQCK